MTDETLETSISCGCFLLLCVIGFAAVVFTIAAAVKWVLA